MSSSTGCSRYSFHICTLMLQSIKSLIMWAFSLLLVLTLASCGKYPDVVSNSKDMAKLDSSTTAIRARELQDSSIEEVQKFRDLDWLDFCSGWGVCEAGITDIGVQVLSELDLPYLTTLNLDHNDSITDRALHYVSSMGSIETLTLSSCQSITGRGVSELSGLPKLENLVLDGCKSILASEVSLLDGFPSLRRLYVVDCTGFDETFSRSLALERPLLRVTYK